MSDQQNQEQRARLVVGAQSKQTEISRKVAKTAKRDWNAAGEFVRPWWES